MTRIVRIRHTVQAALMTLLVTTSADASGAEPWELTPYRIKLLVAVEAAGGLPRDIESVLAQDLVARGAAVVGGAWRVDASAAPAELRHKLIHAIDTVSANEIAGSAGEYDKVILVGALQESGKVLIQARELDLVTELWNVVVRRDAPQAELVPQTAFAAVLQAFAPLARIESANGETATLRLRAGGLARRDRRLPALAPGVAFRPVLVKSDASGTLTRGSAEALANVYLSPTNTRGAVVTCRVDAGAAAPLIPEYHPHRQRLALAVSPSSESTQLRLVSIGDPPAPLEGLDVLDRGELLGRSDRRGLVTIAPDAEAVRALTIRRGERTLATL
ncbi:MAG TPA: hypothetical protein VFV87_00950, partial [Pirellulaceae bacterium]|nr:hypothetical protein [Pirellulaceae bacterium]